MNAKIKCICGREHVIDAQTGIARCDCGATIYIQAEGKKVFPEVTVDDDYPHKEYLKNHPVFLNWQAG